MAAKSERGSLKDPFTSEGKPYFFDVGVADEAGVCYSCHPGGGPAEGIVQPDGTVTPYDDPSLQPVHTYDRDFYDYPPTANTQALISHKSIEATVAEIGAPQRHDWSKSGVMEADCLLCHIDPESPYALQAADGLKAHPFRPRLLIFAKRDGSGQVTEISLGMPLEPGLKAETALEYTSSPQRMTRPSGLIPLMNLPAETVGEMMKMWTDALAQMEAQGVDLPYAIYGSNVQHIWDSSGSIKSEYTPNPAGPADEMQRLQASNEALQQLFAGMLEFLKQKGVLPPDATMDTMMSIFFNGFNYGYQIKDSLSGQLLPIPFPLRAYEPGKFYTDWDNPQASTRDYLRAPFIEGQGIPYTGYVGLAWGATMYGAMKAMQGDATYIDPATGQVDTAKVLADFETGKIDPSAIQPALHEALPYFFYMMPTAQLMGLDLNQDGAPLTYVKIVKQGSEWQAEAYYNLSDIDDGALHMEMFGGPKEKDSWKWVRICGQCHVMYRDEDNSNWDYVRPFGLGMPADWVKNGAFINFTEDEEASGYDVHMSGKKHGCGTCHLRDSGDLEDLHNILKGTDTAHMVRNDLDNNPRPKTCESCHLAGEDPDAPNPSTAHEEKFGSHAGDHIAKIACQTCHVPYRRTWRFRAFNDTFGYYLNFDNGFGYNVLPGGDGKALAFPGPYRINPVYGTSPGYGLGQLNMLTQHIDADGKGVVPMDFISQMAGYFEMNRSADPGLIVNGMPTNPNFDFMKYFYQLSLNQLQAMGVPIQYDPEHDLESQPVLYWANGMNGYPQIVIGNPITIITWVDANPQPDHDMSDLAYGGAKVLYIREMNAAIQDFLPRVSVGAVDPRELANIPPNDPTWAQNPNVARIVLKDSGYVMFDHTGDGFPDLWWDEDVKAMQEALVKVLKAEGEADPKPIIFMAAHYFSDSHGVQPAEKALGAQSCNDCHGDYTKDPGSHRVTDKIVAFAPWAPPWFKDDNRLLKYNRESGKMEVHNPNGFFLVDGEVDYIEPQEANGLRFLGAKAEDVLELSEHHAEELFYITNDGEITGDELAEEGIDTSLLTQEEKETTFLRQVVNGPWNDKIYFYVPKSLRPEVTEMGIVQAKEYAYLEDFGFAQAYEVKYGAEGQEAENETVILRLPFTGAAPKIWKKAVGDYAFRLDRDAVILGYTGAYVIAKVKGPADYVAVDEADAHNGPTFDALYGAYIN